MIILLKLYLSIIFIIWNRRKPQWWQPKHILTFMQIFHFVRILCKSNLVYFVVYTGRYFVLSLSYYVTKMTWLEPQPWIFFLDLWAVQPNTVLYSVHISLAENHLKCKPLDERQVCTLYIYNTYFSLPTIQCKQGIQFQLVIVLKRLQQKYM